MNYTPYLPSIRYIAQAEGVDLKRPINFLAALKISALLKEIERMYILTELIEPNPIQCPTCINAGDRRLYYRSYYLSKIKNDHLRMAKRRERAKGK